MICKELKIAEFSDVHVGHKNTSTVHILENLSKAFPNSPEMGELDIIWIAGDFFDGLLSLPDPNVIEIRVWINRFLRLCKKYDVVLRVLEGTPSHDWKQSRLFTHINEIADIGADVKYIETLSIEYIERFGIHVLYVPDEWEPEPDDTWTQVQQLLVEHGIEQVDFSIMHGAFDYQLPPHVPAPTHVPERYLGITKYHVFIGHVHLHSVKDRIISAGSFDRLCHGEEGPKGYVRVTARQNGQHEIVFVKNEGAKIYKTLNCSGKTVEETLKWINEEVGLLPVESFVRIVAGKNDPILVSIDTLRVNFPRIRFSTKVDKDAEISTETLINMRDSYQPIAITSTNIKKLLLDRLNEKGVDAETRVRAEELLDEYLR